MLLYKNTQKEKVMRGKNLLIFFVMKPGPDEMNRDVPHRNKPNAENICPFFL